MRDYAKGIPFCRECGEPLTDDENVLPKRNGAHVTLDCPECATPHEVRCLVPLTYTSIALGSAS